MNERIPEETNKELVRARKALLAAKILLKEELFEDSISRAYYAVLHAAKAALSLDGVEPDTHDGVRRMFGLHLVKTGKIEKEFARILKAEQEDREIGDYEVNIEIEEDTVKERVDEAEKFVHRIEQYLQGLLG
ncbi:MAG: HEPN domain-containing protein [Bacteroidota bacterium]|nr:HEPN domain-containing protein [Patescibacteria group bacterium]MBU1931969.1 HEPN domain-containing protein [Patescibacteria group bacterium]